MKSTSVSVVAAILGLIMAAVSHAAPFWTVTRDDDSDSSVYVGLWQACVQVPGIPLKCLACHSPEIKSEIPDSIRLVRYLNLPAPCLLLVTCLGATLGSQVRVVKIISCLASGIAGCFLTGSYTKFAVEVEQTSRTAVTFHVCFYGDIIASILSFVACTALIKSTLSSTAEVTPFRQRTRRTRSPMHRAPEIRHEYWNGHAWATREPTFVTESVSRGKHKLDVHGWHTRVSSRQSKDSRFPDETWHSQDWHQRRLNLGHSPWRSRNSHLRLARSPETLHPGSVMQRHGISRESRDSWLSEDIDISPSPPSSKPGSAASYYTWEMSDAQRNLNF